LVAEGAPSRVSQEARGTSIAAAENRRARDASHPNPAVSKERQTMDRATSRRPAPPLSFNRPTPAERGRAPGWRTFFFAREKMKAKEKMKLRKIRGSNVRRCNEIKELERGSNASRVALVLRQAQDFDKLRMKGSG
jgi:hypothetical protein